MDSGDKHPVSCEEFPDGLLFRFNDGTTKFIPFWAEPLRKSDDDEEESEQGIA
jgi:hypothetical protein